MLKLGILPNIGKKDCFEYLKEFCLLMRNKAEIYIATGVLSGHNESARAEKIISLGREIGVNVLKGKAFFEAVDVIVVMGGDGTILCAAPEAARHDVPLLGVNLGRVGYLASADKKSLNKVGEKLLSGDYKIGEHMMLCAEYTKLGERKTSLALNDVVLSRSEFGRIIEFSVYIDDEYADTYTADGIVISTPTGSTAYSLSAGGPIAYPTMEMMLITPVCAHDLNSRPIVVSADKKITIKLGDKYEYRASVTVDGKIVNTLGKNDNFSISKANVKTRLIKIDGNGFYDLLRLKLKGN